MAVFIILLSIFIQRRNDSLREAKVVRDEYECHGKREGKRKGRERGRLVNLVAISLLSNMAALAIYSSASFDLAG